MEWLKGRTNLFVIIFVIAIMNEISYLGLILWVVGNAITFTMIDKSTEGINIMDEKKRRIFLGIGMTLTMCSLINEISWIALALFCIGYVLTIVSIEIKEKMKEKHKE